MHREGGGHTLLSPLTLRTRGSMNPAYATSRVSTENVPPPYGGDNLIVRTLNIMHARTGHNIVICGCARESQLPRAQPHIKML